MRQFVSLSLFIHLVIFVPNLCKAQTNSNNKSISTERQSTYSTALGLRGGYEGGLTFKHFLPSGKAIEVMASRGWGYGGFKLTALYEIQKGLSGAAGFDWYYGIGAHIGFYNGSYYGYYGSSGTGYYDSHGNWHPNGYRSTYTTIGLDGILGIEYQFKELPFTASLDIKPFFDLYGRGSHFYDGALSLRYVIR